MQVPILYRRKVTWPRFFKQKLHDFMFIFSLAINITLRKLVIVILKHLTLQVMNKKKKVLLGNKVESANTLKNGDTGL